MIKSVIVIIGLAVTGIFAFLSNKPNPEKESLLIRTMMGGLNEMHYAPKSIDDSFSENLFNSFLEDLDYRKRFFTQEDIELLSKYKKDLDNEAIMGEFTFFNLSLELMEKRINQIQGIYRDLLSKPLDLTTDEFYETDGEKTEWVKGDSELIDRWTKIVKHEVLNDITDAKKDFADKLKNAEKENSEIDKDELIEKSFEELEKDAREESLETLDKWFKRIRKLERSDRLNIYINAIASSYDPHTNYFAPKDKENFDIRMSGTLEGIGARLQTSDEYTKVTSIVPGGPAWKGKELEAEDEIQKVAQGDEEPLDIKGLRIDEVVKHIRGKKGTEVRLTVKKPDGTIKVISIIRDIVIMDAGFAKSLIVDDSITGTKIGYIKLPSFYADFNRKDGRRCAKDVKTELEKLKNYPIDGIVLDLRFNGGGSLRDVVKIGGYFIEKGPIVQVEKHNKRIEVLKDVDDSVIYDGELVILINESSASASEILAAAMQDYDRAVIVGSKSSFGKGTVQRFIDLDRVIVGREDLLPLGSVKLTMQKFYRINGGSTQLKGVESDIIIPDNYMFLDMGEKDYDNALPWTKIDELDYTQDVNHNPNLDKVKKSSYARIAHNGEFQMVRDNAKRFKAMRDDSKVYLNFDKFEADRKQDEADSKKYKNIFSINSNINPTNLEEDLVLIQSDSSRIARNDDFIKSIKKDGYIEEAINIIHDLNTL